MHPESSIREKGMRRDQVSFEQGVDPGDRLQQEAGTIRHQESWVDPVSPGSSAPSQALSLLEWMPC